MQLLATVMSWSGRVSASEDVRSGQNRGDERLDNFSKNGN